MAIVVVVVVVVVVFVVVVHCTLIVQVHSFIVSSDSSLSIAVNTKHYMSFVINNRNTVN